MLFNATQAEELRVAIVDGQKLVDLDIESAAKEQKKSNIYKAVITRIEPSLEAAFVDYGAERHGFLPFKEISRTYFQPGVEASRATIKEALREGQELIVQVDKDERGNKGAALTTFISLAGRYLVLMPNNPRGGGVSRRVEGDERAELREVMDQLQFPQGMSLIARTAAIGRGTEELQWDLNYLIKLWEAIADAARPQYEMETDENDPNRPGKKKTRLIDSPTGPNGQKLPYYNPAPFLIYQEGSLVIRAIRDYFQPDIGEILIDTDSIFEQASQFMAHVMPTMVNRIKRYQDDVPLFSRFQIEHQIESAYSRQVDLPSGGAIVIDHTEALVSVDVNSGRATRGLDIEETAFKTNLEAAEEVSRQLRLRDLGGLIIIDFIDMESQRNQREVENRLRDGLKLDRARVQTGKISRFGLMELSRQRLRPALAETSYIPCPRCSGTGHIRSAESAALHILRILEEEAMKDNTAAVHTQVPVDVATFLLNEKRADIQAIELRHKVNILLIPNVHLETPQHSIVRLRHDELNVEDVQQPSYKMVEAPAEENGKKTSENGEAKAPRQEAVIKGITLDQPPAPIVPEKKKKEPEKSTGGFFAWIASLFGGIVEPEPEVKPETKPRATGQRDGRRTPRNNGRRDETREARPPREPKEQRKSKSAAKEDAPKTREPRPERKEKEQATPVAAIEKTELQLLPDDATKPAEEANGASRRRGRRGGRRERTEKTGENAAVETVLTVEAVADLAQTVPSAPSEPTSLEIAVQPELEPVAAHQVDEAPAVPASNETFSGDSQMEIPLTASEEAASAPVPVSLENGGEIASEPVPDEVVPEITPEVALEVAPTPVDETTAANQATEAVEIPKASEEIPPEETPAPIIAPPAPLSEEKTADLDKALETSGLVLVETSSEKTQTWQAQEDKPAPKPRRRRTAPVAAPEEPLVMVETRQP
ncbi:ribonuclease E [Betaproteobacteria bacterium]|nr:ribonuclease E [Betaproteobacteria bacterium]